MPKGAYCSGMCSVRNGAMDCVACLEKAELGYAVAVQVDCFDVFGEAFRFVLRALRVCECSSCDELSVCVMAKDIVDRSSALGAG